MKAPSRFRIVVTRRLLLFTALAILVPTFSTVTGWVRIGDRLPQSFVTPALGVREILRVEPNSDAATQNIPATPFAPGNLIVERIGDGSSALSSAAAAVFLEERAQNGALLQTISIPGAASGLNAALTVAGSAAADGHLNRSV